MKIKKITTGNILENCYIVSKGEKCFIIDPGAEIDKISCYIEKNALKPLGIMLTHGHFDHIGAVCDLKLTYNILVYIHEEDNEMLDPATAANIQPVYVASQSADMLLKDEEIIKIDGFEFKIMHTPGHSKGSSCILIEDALFSGDTLFLENIGRTDLYGGSYQQIITSIKEKVLKLPNNITVYPGHGDDTTIAHEKRFNPYLLERDIIF